MNSDKKLKVVIAGGGTAGWMAAASLSKLFSHCVDVCLVESENIGTVGVGEATIPTMQTFHKLLQIDEQEFMRETNATFKLGIQFENWAEVGDKYLHSFGDTGKECWAGQFQHFWLRGLKEGIKTDFGEFSVEHQAALSEKFAITKNPRLNFAYHLDASLYAQFLRRLSEQNGARRIEGIIDKVELSSEDGFISCLHLDSGEKVEGDFFIDCTGFRGLLIEQALHAGYESWTDTLLCDRAVAVQTEAVKAPIPYTRAIAHDSGWQWQIPLQNRVGNGLVFSSTYCSDDKAKSILLSHIEGEKLTEPRIIKFVPGKRKKLWSKNCLAIGLSSGFIEPLESTSIHLISSSLIRFMRMLPVDGVSELDAAEYNRQADEELESIRDFIILHYKATEREDSEFWRYCRNMAVPDSLKNRMQLYNKSARIFWSSDELFTVSSWNQVMLGQGILPDSYHPIADEMSHDQLATFINGYRKSLMEVVEALPTHNQFLSRYCST